MLRPYLLYDMFACICVVLPQPSTPSNTISLPLCSGNTSIDFNPIIGYIVLKKVALFVYLTIKTYILLDQTNSQRPHIVVFQ